MHILSALVRLTTSVSQPHTELPHREDKGCNVCVLGETCPLVNVFRVLVLHQTMSLNQLISTMMLNISQMSTYSRYLKERVVEFGLHGDAMETNGEMPLVKTGHSELYNLKICAQTNVFIRTILT